MNYMLVTVILEMGNDGSLWYGHSRNGSNADHQNYFCLVFELCSYKDGDPGFLSVPLDCALCSLGTC